jgi:pimeloyl-ACP methyl ester carboxylesterase
MQTKQKVARGDSQLTAPNLSIKARTDIKFAYRRYGNAAAGNAPLLLLQHFRGNIDGWDPLVVDTLSHSREVILLDNAGVGLSTGTTPRTVTEMARDAISFCDAYACDVEEASPEPA